MRITKTIDFSYGLPEKIETTGKIPSVSRQMALVIYYTKLIDKGIIKSQNDIARLEKLSTNRISGLMSLSLLSPRIQEIILTLPKIYHESQKITANQCIEIAKEIDFEKQMEMFGKLL